MITKLHLYWDSLNRLSSKQKYYYFLNRVAKRLIKLKCLEQRKYQFHQSNRISKHYNDISIDNLYYIVYPLILKNDLHEKNMNIIDMLDYYPNSLANDICSSSNIKDVDLTLKKRWLDDAESEELNNCHRFHLLDRAICEKQWGAEHAVGLIDKWIDLASILPQTAFDTMNITVRLINWVKLIYIISSRIFLNQQQWRKILNSIATQTSCVYNDIEYELGGNHVLLELYSLWLVGTVFPILNKSCKWIDLAETMIPKEIQLQFKDGAFHCEHSLHYHIQSTIVCLYWLLGMKKVKKRVSLNISRIIQDACCHIEQLSLPDNSMPLLGDKCYPLFSFNTEEDVQIVNRLHDLVFSQSIAKSCSQLSCKRSSHYYVYKQGDSELIVDIGNIGNSANPGHGHSDLLSFVYSYTGIPLFIDPGTRSYDNSSNSLIFKKSTYHNTLCIDGNDQAMLWGYFRWGYLPDELSYEIFNGNNKFRIVGRYTGFKHIGGFRHQRSFEIEKDKLTIKDKVEGNGHHNISFNLILHPGWNAKLDGDYILLSYDEKKCRLALQSEYIPEVTFNNIQIYQEYNLPTKSIRITMLYSKQILPFYGEIILSHNI